MPRLGRGIPNRSGQRQRALVLSDIALSATAEATAVVGPPNFEYMAASTATASSTMAVGAPYVTRFSDEQATANAGAAIGTSTFVQDRGALAPVASAGVGLSSGASGVFPATAAATASNVPGTLSKFSTVTATAASSSTLAGTFVAFKEMIATAAAAPAITNQTFNRVAALAPVARASTTSFTTGTAAISFTGAASTVIANGPFERFAALTPTANASGQLTGQFIAFKQLTVSAQATEAILPVVTPVVKITALSTAAFAGFKGASLPATATGAASVTISQLITHSGTTPASGVASVVLSQLITHSYVLLATGTASVVDLGIRIHQIKANALITFNASGTFAPMRTRTSVTHIDVGMAGSPTSVTGMQGNAQVDFTGTQSQLTLGPPGRFSVEINATARFSLISPLAENVSVSINAAGNLRVVQSLTTIIEEGLPALLPSPPAKAPVPEPAPVLTPAPPTYDRVFFGIRR